MDGCGVTHRRIRTVAVECLRACRRAGLPGNDCLGHAVTFVEAAKKAKLPRCVLQGGSANFPRFQTGVRISADESTHFSYEWKLDASAIELLEKRCLPEMHVWAAFPSEGLFVDLTSGYQERICRKVLGVPMLNPSIPRLVVDSSENLLLLRIYYDADLLACLLAEALRAEVYGDRRPVDKWLAMARAIIEKG